MNETVTCPECGELYNNPDHEFDDMELDTEIECDCGVNIKVHREYVAYYTITEVTRED